MPFHGYEVSMTAANFGIFRCKPMNIKMFRRNKNEFQNHEAFGSGNGSGHGCWHVCRL